MKAVVFLVAALAACVDAMALPLSLRGEHIHAVPGTTLATTTAVTTSARAPIATCQSSLTATVSAFLHDMNMTEKAMVIAGPGPVIFQTVSATEHHANRPTKTHRWRHGPMTLEPPPTSPTLSDSQIRESTAAPCTGLLASPTLLPPPTSNTVESRGMHGSLVNSDKYWVPYLKGWRPRPYHANNNNTEGGNRQPLTVVDFNCGITANGTRTCSHVVPKQKGGLKLWELVYESYERFAGWLGGKADGVGLSG